VTRIENDRYVTTVLVNLVVTHERFDDVTMTDSSCVVGTVGYERLYEQLFG